MKVAISSTDKNIESDIFDTFGRCPYFIIAEIKDGKIEKIETIENKGINQNSGAGIYTAQLMAENNVNAIITANIGPKALDIFKQLSIEIYSGEGIVKDILQAFIDKKLKKIN